MKSASTLLPLLAGLALGSGGAWSARRELATSRPAAEAGSTSSAALSDISGSALPAPGSRLVPVRLSDTEAGTALDAYLALSPLADKAPPAGLADRSARLRALLTVLPTSSFDRFLSALAPRSGQAEAELRRLAFEVWTERAAPAAARWAAALVPSDALDAARARYAALAAEAWARNGFDAAYAWSATLPDARLGRSISVDLLARLAAADPAHALALARAGGEEFFAAAQTGIFKTWAEKDPAAAIRSLGTVLFADDQARPRATTVLGKWAVADPRAAFAWLDAQSGLEPDTRRSTLQSLVDGVTRDEKNSDLRPFADALTARVRAGDGQRPLSGLLREWARRDSSSALAWLDSIPDVALRDDLLVKAAGRVSPEQPETNLPLALHLPPGAGRDDALTDTLTRWAEQHPDAALAWLRDHDDPSLTAVAARVQGVLLGNLAASDPAAALARWQGLPADESRIAAAPGIAKAWAKTDPCAAERWLSSQLPELLSPADFEKLSPQAQAEREQKFKPYLGHLETLYKTAADWSRNDPAGFVAWAQSLPSPPLKAVLFQCIGGESSGYLDDVPDYAARAAKFAAIPDAALRERILGENLQHWLWSDQSAAREWVDSHDALSPEKAGEILARATSN